MIQPVKNCTGPLGLRQRKRAQSKPALAARVVGRQLHVAAAQESRDPAVRAPEVQDENAGVVLQGLNEQEIERETFACAGRAEDERVAHVAVEEVIVKRRLPLGFEDGERGPVQVAAPRVAGWRTVDRRKTCRRASRHKHIPHLPLARLRRQPAKPRRELTVAFPDDLRVVRGEDAEDVPVQPFCLLKGAVQGDRERQIAVGDALGFQLHERIP